MTVISDAGKNLRIFITTFAAAFVLALLLVPLPAMAESGGQEKISGLSPEEALVLGEKMYVHGVLPSGKPMQAMVQGDIPVEGSKFTCANCHQRSGFGSAEGTIKTPPIDGTRLYEPTSQFKGIPLKKHPTTPDAQPDQSFRPAYTDETLARVLLTGQDPSGRQINETMPKYFLNESDMAVMVYYLKHLSTGLQPGVSETGLRFATVVTEDVPQKDRETMLRLLDPYLKNWRISRNQERMARTEAFIREGATRDVRKFSLARWELKGPEETWREQLEAYYRKDPVFALLGGITTGDWAPIHRFCEDHRIPAIFPLTDFPVIAETNWYTLYLSKGLYQEGEAAARYLNSDRSLKKNAVVQVFRKNRKGLVLAKAFEETWTGLGRKAPKNVALDLDKALTRDFWKDLANRNKQSTILLWLEAKDFPDLEGLAKVKAVPRALFASFSLLGHAAYSLPEKQRGLVYLTYPYTLPKDSGRYRESVEKMIKDGESQGPDLFMGYKMQALRLALNGPLSMMRTYVYRDYFLEMIDETADLSMIPVPYPRLSFGPGQRYASKGCYIVQLGKGPEPELISRSEWVISD